MNASTIIEKLVQGGEGAVFPEEYKRFSGKRIRLWTLSSNFGDKRNLRELGILFPSLEQHGLLLKLGECTSLAAASQRLCRVRKRASFSPFYKLFLIPGRKIPSPKPKPFGIVRNSKRRVITV